MACPCALRVALDAQADRLDVGEERVEERGLPAKLRLLARELMGRLHALDGRTRLLGAMLTALGVLAERAQRVEELLDLERLV